MLRIMLPAFLIFLLNPPTETRAQPYLPKECRLVAMWPTSLFEVRAAFTAPISEAVAKSCVGKAIEMVDPEDPKATPGSIRIVAARLADDGRTLVLTTDPHSRAWRYQTRWALEYGPPPREGAISGGLGGNPYSFSLGYDLSGHELAWDDGTGNAQPELTVASPAHFAGPLPKSPEHARMFQAMRKKGRLTQTWLSVLPKGPLDLVFESQGPLQASVNGEDVPASKPDRYFPSACARMHLESTGEPVLISYSIATGPDVTAPQTVGIRYLPQKSTSLNGFAVFPNWLPWAPLVPPAPAASGQVPDLSGGDPKKGAVVFASAEAKCANCHKVRGEGGSVGPDLSLLATHDRKDIYRDIFDPSARVHPDYVAFTVAMKDGRVLVGTVRAEGEASARITDTDAKATVVKRAEIEDIRAGATSIMPVGLAGAIGESKLRDLIAFLASETPAVKPPSAK